MNAAVIGSGIAGIATAIRLAAKGLKVDIYEKNPYPGGKLTVTEGGGFRFDAGPSLFTLPHLVDDLFSLAGKDPHSRFRYKAKEIACNYFWEDKTCLTAYTDSDRFGSEVEQKLGVSAATVKNFLDRSKKKYDLTSSLFLENSLHKLGTYISADTVRAIANLSSLDIFDTIHEANNRFLKHPKLVQLFDRFATYNGSSPYLAPGILTMIPHLEHNLGTYFPEGGMHSITESLTDLALELGVTIHLNSAVEKIVVEENVAKGIIVNGTQHDYNIVVSNSDVRMTYERLLDQPLPKKIKKAEPSSSAIIFYWGINAKFPELDLHNIFFSKDYKTEFDHIFKSKSVYEDPTVYINISSKEHPADSPAGKENWFVMVNTPYNSGQDWPAIITAVREHIITKISGILNRDIAKLIEFETTLDPPSIESKTTSYGGALYGSSSNDRMSAFFRHPNFNQKIKNLYHCGGSAHPGGGIPLCLLSAKIVSELAA